MYLYAYLLRDEGITLINATILIAVEIMSQFILFITFKPAEDFF